MSELNNLLTEAELAAVNEAEAEAKAEAEAEAPKTEDAQEAAPEAQEATQAETPTPVAPEPVAPAPAPSEPSPVVPAGEIQQAQAVLDQIAQKLESLEAQYESGEISFKEFRSAERTLLRHQHEAEVIITQARIEAQIQQATVQREWNAAVADFRKEPGNAAFESPVALPMMQAALNELRAKHPGLSSSEQLAQAKSVVQNQLRAMLGLPAETPVLPVASPTRPFKAPPVLSVVPTTENNAIGEFAALDRLTGLEYERALAKLTPEQQSRYLSA